MAKLTYRDVSKSFDDTPVLNSISLDIADGELIALLGPSGCGKTTLLRLTAGFEQPSSGQIFKNDALLSGNHRHVAPEKRNMGIVFQSYALWPNMSVAENIAYPLKIRNLSISAIEERLTEALETVSLLDHADAEPSTLSGGQRQRVALARCLVMEPDAVLLDEPLANLDAHLRDVMQRTFVDFHKASGATMIYVTHDQSEAMAMADRIAVMFDGEIAQVDKPQTLYRSPASEQVARFIGQGSILTGNVDGIIDNDHRKVILHGHEVVARHGANNTALAEAQKVSLCVRPENVHLGHAEGLAARVKSSVYLGERFRVRLEMRDGTELESYSSQSVMDGELLNFTLSDAWIIEKSR
ncbi:ABC transporter ATP-binding protein [uncultured Cohaesibacter sp.]|uniref:ABC transporter ATP-binding protein n=1 Tax=uncultured Cohaesibacter sp. TaxID=1002546 RepID=UPI00292CDFF8|nr:ABC transporter ATP-binding protein [uncultured Cohaesibacter sp.]